MSRICVVLYASGPTIQHIAPAGGLLPVQQVYLCTNAGNNGLL